MRTTGNQPSRLRGSAALIGSPGPVIAEVDRHLLSQRREGDILHTDFVGVKENVSRHFSLLESRGRRIDDTGKHEVAGMVQNVTILVAVWRRVKVPKIRYLEARLFPDLPGQSGLRRLTGIDESAGKIEEAPGWILRPFQKEYPKVLTVAQGQDRSATRRGILVVDKSAGIAGETVLPVESK
jgi:hypothetical protein